MLPKSGGPFSKKKKPKHKTKQKEKNTTTNKKCPVASIQSLLITITRMAENLERHILAGTLVFLKKNDV